MSMLSNECSKEEARSLLSAAIIKQLEKTAGKDTQMYETALFRASALLINFQGIVYICVYKPSFLYHEMQGVDLV